MDRIADVVYSGMSDRYLVRLYGSDLPVLISVEYAKRLVTDIAEAIKEIERREK